MSSTTTNLNLYKANPTTDGENTFNIDTLLNENWDKIDANVAKKTEIPTIPTSLPANGGNATTVNNHTAAATANTLEKTDLVGMVNEVKDEVDTHSAENVQQFNDLNTQINKDKAYSDALIEDDYKFSVVSRDINEKPTEINYKRSDDTLYRKVVVSNPDINLNYQTITMTEYATDGTTIILNKQKSLTYTNGNVDTRSKWVVI